MQRKHVYLGPPADDRIQCTIFYSQTDKFRFDFIGQWTTMNVPAIKAYSNDNREWQVPISVYTARPTIYYYIVISFYRCSCSKISFSLLISSSSSEM